LKDKILNATAQPIDLYINKYCSKEKIIKFKGMVYEWSLIETVIFVTLNIT
jgi:hypothetical protein